MSQGLPLHSPSAAWERKAAGFRLLLWQQVNILLKATEQSPEEIPQFH